MALDSPSVILLSAAKSIGADFSDTLMVGRQAFAPREAVLRNVFATFGVAQDARTFLDRNKFADGFFRAMGSSRVESLDYSAFEGASHQHDLNLPLPAHLRGKYSLVHDGGTLEHIFNIPQALKNCMEMVRPGGHFTQVAGCNNMMGHGFWQFSPETIFRVFSPANGFSVKAVFLHELRRKQRWVVVTDPAIEQCRVELMNDMPTYILTIAQRTSDTDVFSTFPQQSDYIGRWRRSAGQAQRSPSPARRRRTPAKNGPALLRKLRRAFWSPGDGFSAPYFREISTEDVINGRFSNQ